MATNNTKAPMPANGVITAPAKGVVGGNRKKQKRRAKQALKAAAQQQTQPAGNPPELDYNEDPLGYDDEDEEDYEYSDSEIAQYGEPGYDPRTQYPHNGRYEPPPPPPAARENKGKKRQAGHSHHGGHLSPMSNHHLPPLPHLAGPPPAGMSSAALRSVQKSVAMDRSMDRNIWNTSTQQERQNIKDFWLSLSEDERKALLRIEKEAVLKKMKQQQKHSCSCTVCGRKRTAIEEELEVLYEGYYEELEQYAHHDNPPLPSADGTVPAPLDYQKPPHPLSVTRPNALMPPHRQNSRVQELPDEDEGQDEEPTSEEEDEYSDDDEYSEDEDLMPPPQRNLGVPDFFNFGENLTVKDNLLTVADDLLKNDGRKFIEMMEQLAERRMQRENEAVMTSQHHPGAYPPNDPQAYNQEDPLAAGDEFDDDEASYDSQEEYDDDLEVEDEMVRRRPLEMTEAHARDYIRIHKADWLLRLKGGLTEEQRMQEGKRMFQIFAARMFEQRVLTAYREKVAAERQQKLLEELEDEGKLEAQREAKRARDAEKRKNKKKQQNEAKAELKARKEAEKAAEDARLKEAEEKKQEEQRRKKEEQRKKKEDEKRKQEEEKTRKEAEKQRRQLEEQQRREEAERKAREARAAEKARKEEARKREREEKEARDKEAKDRKAQDEKDKKEREAKAKADKEAKDREKTAQQAAQPPAIPQPPTIQKRPSQAAIAVPGVFPRQTPSGVSSPHFAIATPAFPKASAPATKQRETSHQSSHTTSPKQTQSQVSSAPSKASSPGSASAQPQVQMPPKQILQKPALPQQGPQFQRPLQQTASPVNQSPAQPPPGMGTPQQHHQGGFGGMPPMGFQTYPPPQHGMMHGAGMGQRQPMPMFQHQGPPPQGMPNRMSFPTMNGHNGMSMPPPGMMSQHGRGMPFGFEGPGAGAPPGFGPPSMPQMPNHTSPIGQPPGATPTEPPRQRAPVAHSRQQSASNKDAFDPSITAPIARPAPIQRPSSVKPPNAGFNSTNKTNEVDDLSQHLGSSALIDGSDEPEPLLESQARRQSAIPISNRNGAIGGGGMGGGIGSFGSPSNGFGAPPAASSSWGAPSMMPGGFGSISQHAPQLNQSAGWNFPPVSSNWGHAPSLNLNHASPSLNHNTSAFGHNAFASARPMAPRAGGPRHLYIRIAVCHACHQLGDAQFHDVGTLLSQIERNAPPLESPPSLHEIEEICETEGDGQNGGGELHVSRDAGDVGPKGNGNGGFAVKWEASRVTPVSGGMREIGSPMPRQAGLAQGFGAPGMGRGGFGSIGAIGSGQGQ